MLDGELVFLPNEIPRRGMFACWGKGPGNPVPGNARVELVFPGGTYGIRKRMVSAELIPVAEALPLLLSTEDAPRMRRSVQVWAAAAAAGVGLIARGRLLPTVGPGDMDVWRAGPLDPSDLSWLRELAAAFPPAAHALAIPGSRPMRLRSPEALVRDLWDAIADTIARSPAAARTTASTAFAATEPTGVSDLADWLADTTDGLSAGARLSLRIEAVPAATAFPDEEAFPGEDEDEDLADGADLADVDAAEAGDEPPAPGFRLVLQLRSTSDPSLIVDAASLWSQPETVLARFGPQAETDLLLALRRGASVWPPLAQVLEQASPSAIDLDDDALTSLLGPAAEALAGAGIEVMWPSSMLDDGLELRAAVTPAPEQLTEAGFGLAALLEFRWQLTLDGALLDADEIAALAEAKRPLIRLRGRWVILDPALLDRLRRPPRTRMRTTEALGAVLAGEAEIDGETVKVTAEGPLADLAARIASLGSVPEPVEPPPGLNATLRPYQQRGLAWLAGMCDSGLGGCLADDMGLGKTIQIIALHLHRRDLKAGPTLVVCPASLLGTWEREIRRFAPDIPVRRFHGGGRHLQDLAVDEVVLVTYGVVLRDSERLAEIGWGLVVADEAQHAKNPFSRTARELRAIPAPARIALTGTPVENRLSELWAILDWTTPGLLGHLEAFTRRIARPVELYRDADATARFAALIRPFLLRRKKTDPGIAPELPRKTETDQTRAADRRTGHAVRGDGSGDHAGDRHRRGHRACRAGVQAAHRTQADLQPPGAVPEAARATTRPFGKTCFVRRTDRRDLGRRRVDARLHPVHADGDAVAAASRRARDPLAVPARRRPGAAEGRDGGGIPGGRRAGVPAVAQGGRHRADADPGDARAALRPVVEPGGRGSGDRPGLPDRAGPPGAGAPADRRGDPRGQDRGSA